jgi:hypothetical protein
VDRQQMTTIDDIKVQISKLQSGQREDLHIWCHHEPSVAQLEREYRHLNLNGVDVEVDVLKPQIEALSGSSLFQVGSRRSSFPAMR